LSTYECLLRARAYFDAWTAELHLPARACLEAVVEKEPTNAEALAWLSIVYGDEYTGPFNPRPELYDAMKMSVQTAEKAALLEPSSQMARLALSNAYFFAHNVERSIAEGRAAVRLNPNNVTVVGNVGFFMICAGYDEEGIELLDRAVALNPYHTNWYHFAYFHYEYRHREYQKALETLNKINLPDWVPTQTFFVATYSRLGRDAEMKQAAAQVKRLNPAYSIRTLEKESRTWNMPESHIADLATELRKAGIPENN